jgi:carbon-monoxide dehydrogenase medium subunit
VADIRSPPALEQSEKAMKPAPFSYHRPNTTVDALDMLATLDNARPLAGGQSLVAMLNMRYAFVDHLVDLNRVPELTGISLRDHQLTIGAMTRQCDLIAHADTAKRAPIIAEALSYVGHIQTRNRGTVGGSLAHLDPAAELLCLAALHDAKLTIAKAGASREVSVADFAKGFMTPDIAQDELLTSVRFALPATASGWSYQEFSQRHGDFAVVGVGVLLEPGAGGSIGAARIALIGVGHAPLRLTAGEQMLAGQALSDDLFENVAQTTGEIDMIDDAMASGRYRQRLARVLTRRALTQAASRMAGGGHA